MRLVVANLDAEAELAGGTLGARARDAAAAWGALLGPWGDAVAVVAPHASLELGGDARELDVVTGEPAEVVAARRPTELVAWAETPRVAAVRAGRPTVALDGPPHEAGDAAATRAGHHRRFALETARDLGLALPDARWVGRAGELRHVDPDGPTGAGWVLKAGFSAAGRDRWRGRLDVAGRASAAAFVTERGGALLEPWCPRTGDLGWVGWVGAGGGVQAYGAHRLDVDARGRFVGVALGPGTVGDDDAARLDELGREVGRRLAALGHRGGFGIDAWRWRAPDGVERLAPLGEVNARMTMAHVARAWARRWSVDALRLDAGDSPAAPDARVASAHAGAARARVLAPGPA